MKLIDLEFILQNKQQGIVQNERDIMTVLDHPFILKLEYAFESNNFIVLLLEFCSEGELDRFYFTEICLAKFYLHSLSVIYRDIKRENILIDLGGHIRVADFGLSKQNMTEDDHAYGFCGSPEYDSRNVDHYCLGALLYELVTGLPPYYSRNTHEIYESILKEELNFPEKLNLSSNIKALFLHTLNLLQGLFCKQPLERLGSHQGLAELLTHSCLKDNITKPNQLKFNYDKNDLLKRELETREKLLGKSGLQQEMQIFKAYYFDSYNQIKMQLEQSKILKQHFIMVTKQQLTLNNMFKQQQKKY